MKNLKKILALALCLMLVLSSVTAVSAAEVGEATINEDAKCSLTIYKFDWTNALKDDAWDEASFTSTGWKESYVESYLYDAVREGDDNGDPDNMLGNGEVSQGYAIKGVGFTILRVGEIVTFTEAANDQHPDYNLTQVLYGIHKEKGADLLAAIGLADGAQRYANADTTDKLDSANYYYYTSDVLNKALGDALNANSTTVKNALEAYVAAGEGAITMPLTNEYGKTSASDLQVGLWLCIETSVPEMITSSTAPAFISLPMTTVSGDNNSASPEGGHQWNYNVTIYPKQETGIPTLEKTVREAKADTGKNNGSATITDGFDHNATGSAGDIMEYQIVSTLPGITSKATSLSVYNFYDTICEGLTYNKAAQDVKIEIFTDKACTDKVATWTQNDGKFAVSYSSDDRHMTIDVSSAGLAEINGNTTNINGKLYAGYSNYTIRVTYTAIVNSNATAVYGENGNCNEVVLTWKRTSSDFYDTLIDDCHVYSFGIDITKLFSNVDPETATQNGMFEHVKFKVYNNTDGYWVTAELNAEEGVYYVTGHVAEEADATIFNPVTMGEAWGQVMIKGCEDDEYIITEVETADGYTLLKDSISVVITPVVDADRTCDIYTKDILGVLQNDPHYAFDRGLDLSLANIPQVQLSHNYLTATATVDGNAVEMLTDNESANAEVLLTIVNTPGFDLPQTGDSGTWMYSAAGILLMSGALLVIVLTFFKKDKNRTA